MNRPAAPPRPPEVRVDTSPPGTAAADIAVRGLENDPEGARIVHEELRLLSTVQKAVARGATHGQEAQARGDYTTRLLQLRDEAATAKPEDLPALFDQMHQLEALIQQRGKSAVGLLDAASPYFAHLRLEEGGRRRDVLIGSRQYLDTQAGVRVVDWRNAPVSQIYYRYQEGDDYEEMLGDRQVSGLVLARRSVAIVKGVLRRVSAPQGTFLADEHGTWRRAETHVAKLSVEKRSTEERPKLGRGADGAVRDDRYLPAIAALLDEAQFRMVSEPGAGLMVLQGAAGSGKTTVGLHRVAYLAFKEPRKFRPETMLVVVPNEGLARYVERVLPSLEVAGVETTTFERFARRAVMLCFPKLPTRVSEETPGVVVRLKAHPAMLRLLDGARDRVESRVDGALRRALEKWPEGDVALDAWTRLAEEANRSSMGKARATRKPIEGRLAALAQWSVGRRSIDGVRAPAALPDVTKSAIDSLVGELRTSVRNVATLWDETLTDRSALGAAFRGHSDVSDAHLDQMHAWCVQQSRIRQEGERDGETPSLDAEDDALLLRLWQLLRGSPLGADGKPLAFSHVFVDEVQDENPVALRVLIELAGEEQCVTLSGDVAQRMTDDADPRASLDWKTLLDGLGVGAEATQVEPLRVSYRSTAEITRFARNVLGPLAHEAEPIAKRHGPEVELFEFASVGESVAFLADALRDLFADAPQANIALLSRFAPQADAYFDGLERAEVPNVRRIRRHDFTWEPGVDVTDVRQTKGLEFDEVVLLDVNATSYPSTSQARHALYVAATRAAHQLWCVASDTVSPVAKQALETSA